MACAPSEDSDQPWHPPNLIRVFAVRMKNAWVLSYLLCAQQTLWTDWAHAILLVLSCAGLYRIWKANTQISLRNSTIMVFYANLQTNQSLCYLHVSLVFYSHVAVDCISRPFILTVITQIIYMFDASCLCGYRTMSAKRCLKAYENRSWRIYSKYRDRQAWANSIYPEQTSQWQE